MTVKNLIKKMDLNIFENFSVKVLTWDLYNGFRNWNFDDLEIQAAKVENIKIYQVLKEIWIDATLKQ